MVHLDDLPEYPVSILDTDLYKFTMQQAVLRHFPGVNVTYKFTNRSKERYYTRACVNQFREYVANMTKLELTADERSWLENAFPYFQPAYLDYLSQHRFNPDQVHVAFQPLGADVTQDSVLFKYGTPFPGDPNERGILTIVVEGVWSETILWEVPLMSSLSQAYFEVVDTDWDYTDQEAQAYNKATRLIQGGAAFSEFGSRRRRSLKTHDLVLKGSTKAQVDHGSSSIGRLSGTSNPFFARRYNLPPIGTIAHEWFMGIAAYKGYQHCTTTALSLWEEQYETGPLIALTDTFSSEIFYKDFILDRERVARWHGLRQDSGDPYVFAPLARQMYEAVGVDYTRKTIIYSDALDVDKCLKLKEHCQTIGFQSAFGIGTNLTNDFRVASSNGSQISKALNIVIKISSIEGKPCVKISDELTKNTGDVEAVKQAKEMLGIPV